MTQSAVSYQVKQLEHFAGAPLLHRLARGAELTVVELERALRVMA